uniref:CSON009690 protein n=1 Tax=Culicoides sonorensis TaxID=179676 RepID=A0A336M0U3_CULSO
MQIVPLPDYPFVEVNQSPSHRLRSSSDTNNERNSLEDRGNAAVRLDFRTRRNIQRNILPDIVCDSVLSGFRRYNAKIAAEKNENLNENVVELQNEVIENNHENNDKNINENVSDVNEIKNISDSENNIMGQRTSQTQKPNISFAWVLRGGQSTSSSSTNSSSSCSSSLYQHSSVSRNFITWDKRQQCKNRNKHHLFNEKNLKGSDLDDYRIVRKALLESTSNNNNNTNNNINRSCKKHNSKNIDIDCLSLSTAETTTSISKCVDKATNLKKKRYRSRSKLIGDTNTLSTDTGNEKNENLYKSREVLKNENSIQFPGIDCDTSEFDDFLRKCSLLCPANLPMVLVSDTIMYQTRIGYQTEIFLPLGTLVKGIFSVQDWIYIQLPGKVDHSGYVIASSCIPMGVLPKRHRSLHRPRATLQNAHMTSKSTDNLNLLLKPKSNETYNFQDAEKPLSGAQFEALYARVIDKLRKNRLEDASKSEPARKYSLSTQNLQKFNVLSNEALKNECLDVNFDSLSLK